MIRFRIRVILSVQRGLPAVDHNNLRKLLPLFCNDFPGPVNSLFKFGGQFFNRFHLVGSKHFDIFSQVACQLFKHYIAQLAVST
jgi:hypothetical protein